MDAHSPDHSFDDSFYGTPYQYQYQYPQQQLQQLQHQQQQQLYQEQQQQYHHQQYYQQHQQLQHQDYAHYQQQPQQRQQPWQPQEMAFHQVQPQFQPHQIPSDQFQHHSNPPLVSSGQPGSGSGFAAAATAAGVAPPPSLLHPSLLSSSSYSSPSSSASSISQNNRSNMNNQSCTSTGSCTKSNTNSGSNSNSSSSASSISSTHHQFPSYGSTADFSSTSEPVTPPDSRFAISSFTPGSIGGGNGGSGKLAIAGLGGIMSNSTSGSGIPNAMYNIFPLAGGDNHCFGVGGPLLSPQENGSRTSHAQAQHGLNLANVNLMPVGNLASPPIDRDRMNNGTSGDVNGGTVGVVNNGSPVASGSVRGTGSMPMSVPPSKSMRNPLHPHVITPPSDSMSTIHTSSSSNTVTEGFISDLNRLSLTSNGNNARSSIGGSSFPSSPARYLFEGELHSYSPPPSTPPSVHTSQTSQNQSQNQSVLAGATPASSNDASAICLTTASAASHQRKPSFLQAETTDDKFPILVRRESNGFKTSPSAGHGSRQSVSGALVDFLDPSPILFDGNGVSTSGVGAGTPGTSSATSAGGVAPNWISGVHNSMANGLNGSGLGSAVTSSGSGSKSNSSLSVGGASASGPFIQHSQAQPQAAPRMVYYTPPMRSPAASQGSYFDRGLITENSNYRMMNQAVLNETIPVSSMTLPPLLSENAQPASGILPVTVETSLPMRNNPAVSIATTTKPNGHEALRIIQNPSAVNNSASSGTGHASAGTSVGGNGASNVGSNSGSRSGRQVKSSAAADHELNRYAHASLESMKDEIYSLCKDQHGCRFLQRKLEEKNPGYLNMIFKETYPHVVELMTDPFGNYLCQKLLEYATDEQRTVLMRTAAPDLVAIALNQHGTRALQKMIQYINSSEQVDMIVAALKSNVVKLTQDLNGNHVVQKCLYRLSHEGSQFIYDAVCENCVTVGTHKHGCCVLQRCIDHASPEQKKQLVKEIIKNAFTLVQDQFGNYVAQYVLDLGNKEFSEPMIHQFAGKICILSVQKFSSNVIEKCLRIAEPETASLLIEELVRSPKLDELLRDSYANYVIQTALDYAQPAVRQRLVDNIRPIIPSIRSTPYGRRIQSKLSSGQAASSGSVTPSAAQTSQEFTSPVGDFEWPYRS
ncbi:Puf4p [Sugiyamaella lignohabitans]|uniref:Puf4p n=1 Tax=Sugiyamaella lignohabitans TaxID=796027 RepID=A0A161HH34_9ASCO|nr:Puf4p [Sugiyamaella lignohabitans]ANB11297.1 Puf4p [Sugiyamaella lignohabitans]